MARELAGADGSGDEGDAGKDDAGEETPGEERHFRLRKTGRPKRESGKG